MPYTKYQGTQKNLTQDSTVTTETWIGTRDEMETMAETAVTDESKTARVYQDSGDFWCCEITTTAITGGTPDTGGQIDLPVSLRGGRLPLPLEKAPKYRTQWNHYLFAKKGSTSIPSWWNASRSATDPDPEKYRWGESISDIPGDGWFVLKSPTKPGVTTFEVAVYVVTESIKCNSENTAGNYVRSKLNKITSPHHTFGSNLEWKCDDAEVSKSGKAWIASLTYTSAGNSRGWDKDLYSR